MNLLVFLLSLSRIIVLDHTTYIFLLFIDYFMKIVLKSSCGKIRYMFTFLRKNGVYAKAIQQPLNNKTLDFKVKLKCLGNRLSRIINKDLVCYLTKEK